MKFHLRIIQVEKNENDDIVIIINNILKEIEKKDE